MHFEKYTNIFKWIDNKSIIDLAAFGCLSDALWASRVDAVLPIVKIMWSPL